MKIIRNILLITLALLAQSSLLGRFDVFGIRPDLAMLVFLFIVNTSDFVESILYGFLIGFLQDVYTPEYLGFNALTMSIIGFALGFVRERITVEKGAVRLLLTFFACIVHDGFYLMLYTHFDFSAWMYLMFRASLAGAVYTSILAVVFITAWEWVEEGGLFVVIRQFMGYRR